MNIKGQRIRNLNKHIGFLKGGQTVIVGLLLTRRVREILKRAGLEGRIADGQSLLPSGDFGPVSFFNAEGRYIPLKNKPMETAYRQVEWHWEEFRGRYNKEEMSKLVDVPYQRYQRKFVPPPSVELVVTVNTDRNRLIVTQPQKFTEKNQENLLHTINLFLEMFGECRVYTDALEEILKPPIRRVNWTILPRGRFPWTELRRALKPIVRRAAKSNRLLIEDRFKTINSYGPEFVAVGRGGFQGYVVFAFPAKQDYVLESVYTDNATYVFDEDWETLSQKSKADVLDRNLQKFRFVHMDGWYDEIADLLN